MKGVLSNIKDYWKDASALLVDYAQLPSPVWNDPQKYLSGSRQGKARRELRTEREGKTCFHIWPALETQLCRSRLQRWDSNCKSGLKGHDSSSKIGIRSKHGPETSQKYWMSQQNNITSLFTGANFPRVISAAYFEPVFAGAQLSHRGWRWGHHPLIAVIRLILVVSLAKPETPICSALPPFLLNLSLLDTEERN